MAGPEIVDTAMVAQIASRIEGLNRSLNELMLSSKTTIESLASTWEGEAANATISSYKEFSTKYFQNYYDTIDGYVKFLRTNVDTGFTETENSNTSLADAFK